MRYSSRFFLYVPFLVLALLAAGAMLRWQNVADDLANRLLQANQGREIASGVTLHFASEKIGGFPFNVDAVLDRLTLEVKSTRGPLAWHAEHFAMHALTFGRPLEIFEAAGWQSLSWTAADGTSHRFAFVPGSLRGSAISSKGRLTRFDLDLVGIGSQELAGARMQLHLRQEPGGGAIDVAISADTLHLAPSLRAGFGADIPRLAIEGRFVPATRFGALLSGEEEWPSAMEQWRLHAGTFALDRFEMEWGGTEFQGSGRLSLDTMHRLLGRLALRISGAEKFPGADGRERLADAIGRLTKDELIFATTPLEMFIEFDNGLVNLREVAASKDKLVFPAGVVQPLY